MLEAEEGDSPELRSTGLQCAMLVRCHTKMAPVWATPRTEDKGQEDLEIVSL